MKLRRCPFCGGKANLDFLGMKSENEWRGCINVSCNYCGGSMWGEKYWGDPIEKDLIETDAGRKVAELWNRRSQLPPLIPDGIRRGL